HRIISMANERITEHSSKQKENAESSCSIDALSERRQDESCSSLSDISNDLFEIPSATPNFRTELAGQLAELIPEAVADGKLDVEKLRELLADDVADSNERFGLFWPGKKRALRAAQAPTTATLKPDFANSKDWDATQNVFIEGDNLEVLKILQRHYHNKVKLIYIDPPYNKGKDFVYPDNYREGLDSYLEWTRQVNEEGKKVSTNSETEGRYHSNWLNMMYPRLKLARNLLTDDGVIFISIDDHEQDNLRKLCNEVFGESNLIAVVPTIMNLKGNQDAYGFAETHDYVLVYAKKKEESVLGKFPLDEETIEEDWEEDEHGLFKRADTLRRTGQDASRERRPKGWFPIFIAQNEEVYATDDDKPNKSGDEVVWPINDDGFELSWTWGKTKINSENFNLVVVRRSDGRPNIYKKQRPGIGDVPSSKPKSVMYKPEYSTSTATTHLKTLFDKKKLFETPKPIPFIKDVVKIGSPNGGIVLDFFAGSATTAHAVMQLNAEGNGKRRFIMVQLPEPTPEDSEARKAGFATIADISRKRIELAGEKIKSDVAENQVDTGFRAYKLADTNFTKWRVTSDIEPDKLTQHLLDLRGSSVDDASPGDLLTELLLKLGYSLNEHLSMQTIAGLDIHAIAGDTDKPRLLAYFNERTKPTLEQLRELVNTEPTRLIILEDAFHGDDELKTNIAQYARSKGIELRTA
ncbi:site-specific DNA-methyltransferase, partial [Pectobacterium versatile]|uniref:site-specific DNA-methyltransferase n=2 Tax=Pectobacterium versatile TaxID=2488639 RepID=UPI001F4FFE67